MIPYADLFNQQGREEVTYKYNQDREGIVFTATEELTKGQVIHGQFQPRNFRSHMRYTGTFSG